MYTIEQLNDKLLSELKAIAEDLKISGITKLSKKDLIYKIIDEQAVAKPKNDNWYHRHIKNCKEGSICNIRIKQSNLL